MSFLRSKQQIPLPTYNADQWWDDFFKTALSSLLDYETREDQLSVAVRKASLVADLSLDEYEKRWRNK